MDGYIVTGISTDVGKTVASAILAKAWNADYWKPIEAGGNDTETVSRLSGVKCHPPAYQLTYPVSPHQAAQLDQTTIEPSRITLPKTKRLIIEGCGGVLVPYGNKHLGELFSQWKLPWIVVSKNYLGSINHTLLTLAWLQANRQKILGVLFNGKPNPAAEQFILSYTQVPCLGRIYPEKILNQRIIACYARQLNETCKQSGTRLHNGKSTRAPSPL